MILMSVLENMQVITCCSGMFRKWLTWRCNSLTKLRNLSAIKKFWNYYHIKCNIVQHAWIPRNHKLFFEKIVMIWAEAEKKNTFQTVKKLMNNHTQELVIYHFCCLLNIMIGTGFICKYTEWWGGGGLIVCISAASSLVSIILKSIFLLQNKDNNIFTIIFFNFSNHRSSCWRKGLTPLRGFLRLSATSMPVSP